jgi:hypothetical protein
MRLMTLPVADMTGASWVRFQGGANRVGMEVRRETVHGASESGFGKLPAREKLGQHSSETPPKGDQGTRVSGQKVQHNKKPERLGNCAQRPTRH